MKVSYAFEIYDIDNNNILDEKEIKRVLEVMFKLLKVDQNSSDFQKCYNNIMNSLDANRDKKLSKSEFIEGILYFHLNF